MPGMNFKSRGNRNTVITNDNQKQHLQDFNFTLQPLLGVGKNIRSMIEPEESDIVLEESSLLSSYSTNYNQKGKLHQLLHHLEDLFQLQIISQNHTAMRTQIIPTISTSPPTTIIILHIQMAQCIRK